MPVTPLGKACVFAFGLFVLLALALGAAGRAAATQGAPSWSAGDYWVYAPSSGNGTVTWTAQQQTTVTVGANTLNVWHTIVSTSSGSISISLDMYLTTDGLRVAKTSGTLPFVGLLTITYDPAMPTAVFPLSKGSNWQGSSSVTTVSGFGTGTTTQSWSGTVTTEDSVTVPAGTFTAAAIRSPSAGDPYDVSYYSESVGWLVKTEHYSGTGALTGTDSLTSYKYSGNGLLLILLIIGVLAVVAVVGLLVLRRRRPQAPQGMPPQYVPTQQPYYPPQQPPQNPPGPGP